MKWSSEVQVKSKSNIHKTLVDSEFMKISSLKQRMMSEYYRLQNVEAHLRAIRGNGTWPWLDPAGCCLQTSNWENMTQVTIWSSQLQQKFIFPLHRVQMYIHQPLPVNEGTLVVENVSLHSQSPQSVANREWKYNLVRKSFPEFFFQKSL